MVNMLWRMVVTLSLSNITWYRGVICEYCKTFFPSVIDSYRNGVFNVCVNYIYVSFGGLISLLVISYNIIPSVLLC